MIGATLITLSGVSPTVASAAANRSSAPGITAKTVTIGLLTSLTGLNASTFSGTVPGAMARFSLQASHGGVYGRTVRIIPIDDQSNPAVTLAGIQAAVEQKGVFAILAVSGLTFAAAPYLNQAGVPVVGSALDGPEWYEQPYTNMISFTGNQDPKDPQYTTTAAFLKKHGATDIAALGYQISPSSSASARGIAFAAKQLGVKVGYLNDTVPFASVDVGSYALAMKSAGVDGLFLPLALSTNIAMLTAAQQAGIKLKAVVSETGYGQQILDQPAALAAAQGAYFGVDQTPVELHTGATRAEQAALAKYAHFTGVPGFDYSEGWLAADLFLTGLQKAGPNPTRESYIAALHKVAHYTGGGLLAQPVSFSLKQFGHAPARSCGYFVQLKGKAFVPVPADGRPVCGTLLANSEQLTS